MASSGESFAMFAFAPAFTALKKQIGWRYCFVIIGILQASVIGCGALLRPIIIEPETERAEDESEKQSLSLKQLETVYEMDNEITRTSISSGNSNESQDSGVTSLSASTADLQAATATAESKALMDSEEEEEKEAQGPSLSTASSPVKQLEAGVRDEEGEVKEGPLQPSKPKLLDFSVLKDGGFIFYSLFGLFATLAFFAPQLYIIELSKSRGVDPNMASYMLSVMAVSEVCGRLSIGVVLNKVCCRKTRVLLGCVVLLCLVLLAFTLVWEFWGLVVCCALYGFFMGTVGSTHIPLLAEEDVVGVKKMASSVGVYVCIQSFAGLAGPPLGGVLVDITQDYGSAFYSCVVGMALGAICLALVGPAKSGMCQRGKRNEEEDKRQEEKEQNSPDIDQPDFLEVDLALESSPVRQALSRKNSIVI